MNIPTHDRLLNGAVVIESAGRYVTTVSNPVPKAEFLHEMEQKNYVMVGVPMSMGHGSGHATYVNWKWVSPK